MTWFKGCLGEIPPTHEDYGKSCEPMWSTPEVKATVDSYGYDNLGRCLEADMPVVWAQLRKAYEQICKRKEETAVNKYVLKQGEDELKKLTSGLSKKMIV